jgi:hypothetical protein
MYIKSTGERFLRHDLVVKNGRPRPYSGAAGNRRPQSQANAWHAPTKIANPCARGSELTWTSALDLDEFFVDGFGDGLRACRHAELLFCIFGVKANRPRADAEDLTDIGVGLAHRSPP